MRRLAVLGMVAFAPAHARVVTTVESPDLVNPASVRGKLDGPTAELVVRFALPVHERSWTAVSFAYPTEGVITEAVATIGGASHRLALLDAEVAQNKLDELLAGATIGVPGWMLKLSGGSGTASVDIVAADSRTLGLEVHIEAATCFFRDARYVGVPIGWKSAVDPALRITRASEREISENCTPDSPSGDNQTMWIAFPSRELLARPAGDSRIAGFAMRLPVDDRHLVRLELDLAREISKVPADLHTAFVVDGSRSLTARESDVQRAVIASYVRNSPTTRIQVISYAHTAKALLPGWSNAGQMLARLDRMLSQLAPKNGSDLDVGLAEASTWLSRIEGTRRIVLFTDERVAQRLLDINAVSLRALLPPNTLVHVVVLGDEDGGLTREEETMFGDLATATDGIAVRARLDEHHPIDAKLLVRPIRLEKLKLVAPGWERSEQDVLGCFPDADHGELTDAIDEGQSCTWLGEGTAISGPLTVEGLLWGKRFTRTIRPDATKARTLARLLSAMPVFEEDLQAKIDKLALAVNASWSLAVQWGGPGGYADLQSASANIGIGGMSSSSGSVIDTIRTVRGAGAQRIDVSTQFADAVANCEPDGARVEISIETTLQEIVGVTVEVDAIANHAKLRALRACIDAAVWDTPLVYPNAPEHASSRFVY